MEKVGVTGGAGFIGSYVVQELLDRGYEPVIMDHHDRGGYRAAEIFLGDVTDPVAMTEFAAHVDGIIHLAAVLGTQETIQNPRPAATSNLVGGLNFLEAINQYDLPGTYIAVGNWWMNNPYSITKNMIERFVKMYNNDRDGRVNVVRAVNAYGPGQLAAAPFAHGKVRKITPALICRALCGMPMELYGGGTQVSDMVYVADVAKALVTSLEYANDDKVVDTVEIGPSASMSINRVAHLVNEIVKEHGYKPVDIVALPMRPGENAGDNVSADVGTLSNIGMSYTDLVHIDTGMRTTVEYFIDTKGIAWKSPV